jgi:hypothetical protein
MKPALTIVPDTDAPETRAQERARLKARLAELDSEGLSDLVALSDDFTAALADLAMNHPAVGVRELAGRMAGDLDLKMATLKDLAGKRA